MTKERMRNEELGMKNEEGALRLSLRMRMARLLERRVGKLK